MISFRKHEKKSACSWFTFFFFSFFFALVRVGLFGRPDHERDVQPLPQEARGHGLRRNRARQERHGRDAQDPEQDGADRRLRDAVPRDVVLQAVMARTTKGRKKRTTTRQDEKKNNKHVFLCLHACPQEGPGAEGRGGRWRFYVRVRVGAAVERRRVPTRSLLLCQVSPSVAWVCFSLRRVC